MNFYNDNDPRACAWLRELIRAGEIPPGDVSEKSITDIKPDELTKYTQCHFFAGIAGWSRALDLAGWPRDRPVWTASLPCQPFSAAGAQRGQADERHLYPVFSALVEKCRPQRIFGEQVEAAIRFGWLDGVCSDLGAKGYTVGAIVLGAHSASAPHIRQRLFWVADAKQPGLEGHAGDGDDGNQPGWVGADPTRPAAPRGGAVGWLADPEHAERRTERGPGEDVVNRDDPRRSEAHSLIGACGEVLPGRLGHPESDDQRRERESGAGDRRDGSVGGSGFWDDFDWLPCRDGKWRRAPRAESGIFPLANGFPRGMVHGRDSGVPLNPQATGEGRVMRLKGYGNAINAVLAAEFIIAADELLIQPSSHA